MNMQHTPVCTTHDIQTHRPRYVRHLSQIGRIYALCAYDAAYRTEKID